MSKLIMMRGLPASGKSTKAAEIIAGGGEFFRVNRDLLRTMLHNNVWTGKREGTTIEVQQIIVADLLTKEKNVIVDDTNLGEKHLSTWRLMAESFNANFEVIDMMKEVSVAECIERDAQREKGVGKAVIENMAFQYHYYGDKKIVVCDIDGTVADGTHRQHHLAGEKKDWLAYFAEMAKDTPRTDVYESARALAEAHDADLVFVSARPEDYREVTEQWLRDNGMDSYTHLLMRPSGNKRPDTDVKGDIYKRYLQQYEIVMVFDDRPAVIRMWQELGLDVEDVGNGEEF